MADQVRLLDCVRVATTTGGTGAYSVGATLAGWLNPFAAGAISGQRYTWRCENDDASVWELFEGTITSGSPAQISRNRIIMNSGGVAAAVNWPAGTTKILTCLAVTDRLVYRDTDGLIPAGQMQAPLVSQLFSNTGQSIPHNSPSTMSWSTIGANTLGAAGASGFTLPSAGFYRFTLNLTFEDGNGVGVRSASLIVGGVDRGSPLLPGSVGRADLGVCWEASLPASTVITAIATQTSGVALFAGGNPRNSFSCVRLG